MLQPGVLNQAQTASESEYTMQSRSLEQAIKELDERLSQLSVRLEPIKYLGPEKPNPELSPPDSPMSPMCDFLRQTTRKVNQMERSIHTLLQQIQI